MMPICREIRGDRRNGDISRFLQTPLNVSLAEKMPLPLFRTYVLSMGLIYYSLHPHEVVGIHRALGRALPVSSGPITLRRRTFKTLQHTITHYYEKMVNAYQPFDGVIRYLRRMVRIVNRSRLDHVYQSGKGCLLITGHFGAVEYLPLFLATNGYKVSMVVRFKTRRLRDISFCKIGTINLELIDADDGHVVHRVIGALKQGRIVVTLCDEFRHWRPDQHACISVFGRVLPADRTLDVLQRRTGAPACVGLMQRWKGHVDLVVEPMDCTRKALSLQAWETLAGTIRSHPEQWYQWHKLTSFDFLNIKDAQYATG